MKTGKFVLSLVSVALICGQANAQSDGKLDTPREIAACAALSTVLDDLAVARDREGRYLDGNDNCGDITSDNRYYDCLERLGSYNALNDQVEDVQRDYNNACIGNFSVSDASSVCSSRSSTLNAYLYDSEFCEDLRGIIGD